MKFPTAAIAASTLMLGFCFAAHAEVKPHALFSDDMILQRDKPIPIWGTADAGEKVQVTLERNYDPAKLRMIRIKPPQFVRTTADANGNWKVILAPEAYAGRTVLSYSLIVAGEKKEKDVVFKNVAVGDVYIASGQSNMEWALASSANAQAEIAAANYPNIRLFTVPKKVAGAPQKEFASPTRWQVCTPQTVPGFSAVAYFFGRELNQKIGVPIGLINSSWGGTIAQAWTSRNTLLKRDDLRDATLQTEKSFVDTVGGPLAERMAAWWKANDAGSKNGWSTPDFDDAAWKTMKLPGAWEGNGLADFDGLAWFRKTVEIPAAWEGKDLTLHLGAIDDRDTTFWNGEEIGGLVIWNVPRVYTVPAKLVKAGRVTISVRVLDTGGGGGFGGGDEMRLELVKPDANAGAQKLDVAGDWKYQVSTVLKDLPPAPTDLNNNPNQPTVLFNGMIAPLVPFGVRGAIWYQGESNAGNPKQYQTLFPDLIKDWRTTWNAKQDGSEFGFYFVQLANFMARTTAPVESGWAELRDAQTQTLKLVPRTGMATILDVGDAGDIHPRNKQDVGKRLALAALATEYKQKIEYSGPTFHLMEMEAGSNRVKIHFTNALGLTNTGHVRATEVEGKVPLSSWVYENFQKLNQAGIIEGYPAFDNFGKYPMSRKELANEFVKLILKLQPKIGEDAWAAALKPQANEAGRYEAFQTLAALVQEFKNESKSVEAQIPAVRLDAINQVKGFAIQDEAGKWHAANARIEGESVVVWSGDVPRPVAVRYAWANNPDVNLVNAAGLPAIPFATDGAK